MGFDDCRFRLKPCIFIGRCFRNQSQSQQCKIKGADPVQCTKEASNKQSFNLSKHTTLLIQQIFKVSPVNHVAERIQGISTSRRQPENGLKGRGDTTTPNVYQENAPKTCSQAILIRGIFSVRVLSSQMILAYTKLAQNWPAPLVIREIQTRPQDTTSYLLGSR